MAKIEIDFIRYLPGIGTLCQFFEILKDYHYITDVQVVQEHGTPTIRIFRNESGAIMK